MDLFQYPNENVRSIGADDVAVSLNLRPLAIDADDVDDAGAGVALTEQTNRLACCGRGHPVAEKDRIMLFRSLGRFNCFLLGSDNNDLMSCGFEDSTAELR